MWIGLLVSRCATNKTATQDSKLRIQGKSKTATQVATSQIADTNFILERYITQMPTLVNNQCPYENSKAWSEGKIRKVLSKAFQHVGDPSPMEKKSKVMRSVKAPNHML